MNGDNKNDGLPENPQGANVSGDAAWGDEPTQSPPQPESGNAKEPNAPPSDGLIGKQLGDYTLIRVIASGGMARIYEAVDRQLGRVVAIKVLIHDGGVSDDPNDEDNTLMIRFKREASAVAQLDHENIIQVYQYGEQDGIYWIAMKLIRGKDLAQELGRLRRAGVKLDLGRALKIMEQIADALDAAHKAGIIHRDIKPSNILVDADDRAMLTDFGLVLRPSVDTTFGTAFGTPRYVAPEQVIASNTVSPQTDIYSLAIVMYEILTGQTPFNGESPMEIALNHIHQAPPNPRSINPNIPEAVEKELLKALDKTPENRHKTALSFIMSIKRAYGIQIDDTPLVPFIMPSKPKPPEGWEKALAEFENSRGVGTSGSAATPKEAHPTPVSKGENDTHILPKSAAVPSPIKGTSAAKADSAKKSPPFALIALVAVGLVAVIALIAILPSLGDVGGGGSDSTQEPSPTPLTLPITLDYSEGSFVIANGGGSSFTLSHLSFAADLPPATASAEGTPSIPAGAQFTASQFGRSELPAGTCLRIRAQGQRASLPNACRDLHAELQPPAAEIPRYFWRRETGAQTFNVLFNGEIIGNCSTIARGGANSCDIILTLSNDF